MKILLQIGFVLLVGFLGFVTGAAAGAQFVADKAGMAGSAAVVEFGVGGLVVALAGGTVLSGRLRPRILLIALLVVSVLAALSLVWIGYRLTVAHAEGVTEPYADANR